MALMTLIVTAGVPLFIRYLQIADAEHDAEAEQRRSQLATATATFEEISETLSRLHYQLREALYASIYETRGERHTCEDDVHKVWDSYCESATQWEEGRVRFHANVEISFGQETSAPFSKIDDKLRKLMRQVEATYYSRPQSQNYLEPGRDPSYYEDRFFVDYRETSELTQQLNRRMLEAIQEQRVGSRRPHRARRS